LRLYLKSLIGAHLLWSKNQHPNFDRCVFDWFHLLVCVQFRCRQFTESFCLGLYGRKAFEFYD
jgi:hypothetical protein